MTIVMTTLVEVTCPVCAVPHGIPDILNQAAREQTRESHGAGSKKIYCPNGHTWCYLGKTEAQKLKEEKAALEQRLTWANSREAAQRREREAAERKLAAQKGVNTKLKKRAVNGVCPCCNRSFANVRRHVTSQHPEAIEAIYTEEITHG